MSLIKFTNKSISIQRWCRTKMLGSLIEPLLIIFMALIVGVVLVSMYLPIF